MVKYVRTAVLVAALVVVFLGCGQLIPNYDSSPTPPSTVNTSGRSGEFAFESLFSVSLSVDVALFDYDGMEIEGDSTPAIVSVTRGGSLVYRGAASTEGGLKTTLQIPADWQRITVAVEKPGYESQRFSIDDPADLSRVTINANLGRGGVSTQLSGEQDTDLDGIPDIYDADPDDDDYAFSLTVPADGLITVAYEDNFPEVGDGDYNDFVASYEATAHANGSGVTSLEIDVTARARVAGYDHEFGFVVTMPGLRGALKVEITDPVSGTITTPIDGAVISDPSGEGVRIPVFTSTKAAFTKTGPAPGGLDNGDPDYLNSVGHEANIRIYQIRAIDSQNPPDPWVVEMPPFDPYLLVEDTGYDVHLIGKPALDGSKNHEVPLAEWEDFRDQAGYPRALLVPTDWGHPLETLHIEEAYPNFRNWRLNEGGEDSTWYLQANPGKVIYPPER